MATTTQREREAAAARRRRRASAKAAARREMPTDFWRRDAAPQRVGEDRWRLTALRGAHRPKLYIDSLVESFDWQDISAILEGTITLRLPPRKVDLTAGHVIVCEHARGRGRFTEVWRMRISAPEITVKDGGYQLTLADDMKLLQQSKDDFDYRSGKAHPHGWLPHEILADVARRYGFRIGRIPRMRHRIKKLHRPNSSPLDTMIAALLKEKEETKKQMVLRWRKNKLEVIPLRRSATLLALGPMLIDAGLNLTMRENLATAITVRARVGKKGHRKKYSHLVVSKAGSARYGFIHRKLEASDADTPAEAIAAAKRRLARLAQPKRELTITVPGMVALRRGHAIRVVLPDLGLRQVVYAKEVRHTVSSGGGYDMEVVCRFTDPYADADAKQLKAKIKAAAKHARKTRAGNTSTATKHATPTKAKTRSAA